MNTFLIDLNPKKTSPYNQNQFHLTNRSRGQNAMSLTQKGLLQAHRNDSTDMWKLIHNWQGQTQADSCQHSCSHSTVRPYDYVNEEEQKSFKRSKRPQASSSRKSNDDKGRSPSDRSLSDDKKIKEKTKFDSQKGKQSKNDELKIKNSKNQKGKKTQIKNMELKQEESGRYENLERMNQEIKQYLEKQRFASRSLSNSAFAKLYNKPCVQSYGFGNTSAESQSTNNLLKTHNITPHTNQNKPSTYQSYKTALMFAKRSRIDEEDKQERLRRQFLRFFDDSVVEAAKIQLNKKNQERKAKSQEKLNKRYEEMEKRKNKENEEIKKEKLSKRKSLKELLGSNEPVFVYRHTDRQGNVRVSTDRHGLSCYVDSGYHANDQALLNFQIKQRPILPEKVIQDDMNLDAIRKENFKKSVEQCHPSHYLVPCVQTPYDKNKYSFRRKRAESMVN